MDKGCLDSALDLLPALAEKLVSVEDTLKSVYDWPTYS